ncbi:lipoprotein-releasing ABC transporter permease subunit [Bowmanella dokdonensis]|uniref:Lipoprotein-releasing ABC transporter permease subunit n=1 Tax=Bowmanella dokdonensis TaxID=751969 RepID=A0A939DKY3_9ALTE|nr:lipoprotein-releasing ABC transporter permease subunit [Bowmanella dokdonensis]MBN7824629.1 lipoprotein-releasing ABC transporter permease subunit [Bowmanella dokdonensis]
MYYPVSIFIGLRYARTRKGNPFIAFINLFSVAGIALGLAALITVSSVMNGFEAQLKNRILGITPHFLVRTAGIDPVRLDAMEKLPHVVDASPMLESEGLLQAPGALRGVLVQGIDPAAEPADSVIGRHMLLGELSNLQPGEYGLVLGRPLAAALQLGLGDRVRLISAAASVYTPFGRVPSQRRFRIVGIFDVGSELDDKVVLIHLHDAARLQRGEAGELAQTRLYLDDAFAWQQVKTELEKLDLESRNWRDRQGPLFDAVKMEKNMMALMLVLIIAVAAFNIVSAMVMVVTEKRGDIAILRTQGLHAPALMRVFLVSGLYNGLKGTLIGLFGGWLLASQLNNLLQLFGVQLVNGLEGQGLPVDLRWSQVWLMVCLSLVLSLLATLYPAYRAMQTQPAAALRDE